LAVFLALFLLTPLKNSIASALDAFLFLGAVSPLPPVVISFSSAFPFFDPPEESLGPLYGERYFFSYEGPPLEHSYAPPNRAFVSLLDSLSPQSPFILPPVLRVLCPRWSMVELSSRYPHVAFSALALPSVSSSFCISFLCGAGYSLVAYPDGFFALLFLCLDRMEDDALRVFDPPVKNALSPHRLSLAMGGASSLFSRPPNASTSRRVTYFHSVFCGACHEVVPLDHSPLLRSKTPSYVSPPPDDFLRQTRKKKTVVFKLAPPFSSVECCFPFSSVPTVPFQSPLLPLLARAHTNVLRIWVFPLFVAPANPSLLLLICTPNLSGSRPPPFFLHFPPAF